MQWLHTALAWVAAHDEFMLAFGWPVLTALLTVALKPRTPEEYAALPPRLAAFLQLIAALGLDPIKAVAVTRKLVSGASTKPSALNGTNDHEVH